MANRTGKGGFQKGQSGNPGGRPKVVAEVRDFFLKIGFIEQTHIGGGDGNPHRFRFKR